MRDADGRLKGPEGLESGFLRVSIRPELNRGGTMAGKFATQGGRVERERRFYARMAWFIVIAVVLGFGPSFYLKPLGLSFPRPNPELVPSLMVHGLVFTAWVALFFAQVSLVGASRRDLHRNLGVVGMVLGLVMIPVMYLTATDMVARGSTPPFTDPLTWSAVPMVAIPVFVVMLWLGWRESRRDLAAHKRLMLGIMLMLLEPALHRLPLFPPTMLLNAVHMVLCWLVFVPLIVWDMRTLGRLHWATKTGAGLFALVIASQIFFLAVPGLWSSFVVLLPGF